MEVHELLEKKFGSVTNVEATKVVSQAFPEAERDRSTYMIGIRPVFTTSAASMSTDVLTCPGPSLRSPISPSTSEGIFSPPLASSGLTSPSGLFAEVQMLRSDKSQLEARVLQLEEEIQSLRSSQQHSISIAAIEEQIDKLLSSNSLILQGPNSEENFEAFSIRLILQDLQRIAPDLLRLFNSLGKMRHAGERG